MSEFTQEELRDLVLTGYDLALLTKLEFSQKDNNPRKYEIKSRNKIKTLPEALREFDDPAMAITHFVKNAAYFLPRADSGGGKQNAIFIPFLDLLLKKVNDYSSQNDNPEHIRKKIQYLIGYGNWSSDSLCFIFSSVPEKEIRDRVTRMLKAELTLVGGKDNVSTLVDRIMRWKNTVNEGEDRDV